MSKTSQTKGKSNLRRTVLNNGVRVVSERVDYVRSVSLGVWLRAGSRDEQLEQSGISHFLEHVVFKGSGRRSALEIAQALESVGGGLDAFTSREHTCFLARVLGDYVPVAVDVISDLVKSPALASGDIELEKQIVMQEINSMEDMPDELVHEAFAKCVWHDHPLKNPILGCRESVGSFTSEKLRDYLDDHYTRDRIVVAAAGYLEHDRIVDMVETHLGSLSKNGASPIAPPDDAFMPVSMNVRDLSQEHICIGCRSVSFNHSDRYAVLLLASLLGGGMSSRLYQSVRETSGLAYAVSTYADFLTDSGLFGTYVAVSPDKARAAVDLILKEISRVNTEGIPPSELESLKAQLTGGLMINMEGMTQRMSRLAKAEINGRPIREIDVIISEIQAVSAEDIVRVLGELMQPGRICLAGLGPLDETAISGVDLV